MSYIVDNEEFWNVCHNAILTYLTNKVALNHPECICMCICDVHKCDRRQADDKQQRGMSTATIRIRGNIRLN